MESPQQLIPERKAQSGSLKPAARHPQSTPLLERLLPSNLRGRFLVVLFGVLLPSLTLFGVLHHDSVKRSLLREVDQTLKNRASEVEQVLEASGIRQQEDLHKFQMVTNALKLTSAPEVYVHIMNERGETLWASQNFIGKSISTDLTDSLQSTAIASVAQPDGLRLRRLSKPLKLKDDSRVILVLAESLTHLEAALQGSIGRTVLLGLIVLTLTEIAANLAFRGIFYPLRNLVDTAETIVSTDDVTRRVPVYEGSDHEIKRTAVAFNQLMARVEQLLGMAKRLLADTSHELRNPLTVIMTDLDLLREDLDAEQRDEVVTEAQRTVRRLNRLVSDLLLLSRTEAHSETIQMEEVPLLSFTTRIVQRFAGSLDSESRVLMSTSQKPTEAAALIDAEKTEQILTNLLENAIRYSDSDDVEVAVFELRDKVEISVRDSGCGIAEEEQENIFHRFYRVDASRNRHSGGTGLGLSVARALARLQNGDIRVKSEFGEGAEFRVVFPKI